MLVRTLLGVVGFCSLLLALGCQGPAATLDLDQPRDGATRRTLLLESNRAIYGLGRDGVARVVIEFPLPGARRGGNFVIYLRIPEKAGLHSIGDSMPDGARVAGFLASTAGREKGLTEFVSGEIDTDRPSGSRKSGRIRLKCADGSTLAGRFKARRDDLDVRDFERKKYPGEVASLTRARPSG